MTILQDRPTAEMEEAVRNGFDLSWLQQLKQQIPGAADELANDPTLAEHTPELLNESPNQTQRTRGAIPREGVPQYYAEAVKWYRRAAEQGHAGAQFNLGVMYANGDAVPQDYVAAHTFFNLAGAKGDEDARKQRDRIASRMTAAQIAEAQRRARAWTPKTSP